MIISKETHETMRFLHKNLNAYEVQTKEVTTFFVDTYGYWKTKRDGEQVFVLVEGHVREIVRNYVHFENAA